MIKCPHCGSSNFCKNGHSHDGSQQYLCKSCHRTFRLSSFKKPKLFSFSYPKCPVCGRSMQIYKIRRGFIRFRCKSCKTKTNVNRFIPPEPIAPSLSSFSCRTHPYFVFLAIFLYFKRNMSFRAITDALPINISHVSIYKWVIKFGSLPFSFCSAFLLSADETVILFKDRKYYIWFLVDWNTLKIVAWHFSRYRDYSNAIKLLKQIKQHPNTITTDGLPVYKQVIEELFGTGVHQRVRLGYNNAVESRYSLLKDFIRMKRGFKKFSNIPKYINGWVYIHNLFKDLRGDKNAIIQFLLSTITLS